jgi:hypothetical protein
MSNDKRTMPTKYRVVCMRHYYDTLHTLDLYTAVNAAVMHAMLPCDKVEVHSPSWEIIDWKALDEQWRMGKP